MWMGAGYRIEVGPLLGEGGGKHSCLVRVKVAEMEWKAKVAWNCGRSECGE